MVKWPFKRLLQATLQLSDQKITLHHLEKNSVWSLCNSQTSLIDRSTVDWISGCHGIWQLDFNLALFAGISLQGALFVVEAVLMKAWIQNPHGQAIKATLGVVNRRQEEPGSLKEASVCVCRWPLCLQGKTDCLDFFSKTRSSLPVTKWVMSHEMLACCSVNICFSHSEQTCTLNFLVFCDTVAVGKSFFLGSLNDAFWVKDMNDTLSWWPSIEDIPTVFRRGWRRKSPIHVSEMFRTTACRNQPNQSVHCSCVLRDQEAWSNLCVAHGLWVVNEGSQTLLCHFYFDVSESPENGGLDNFHITHPHPRPGV